MLDAPSFVYEKLIDQVQNIQNHLAQMTKNLARRLENGTAKREDVKHRSLTFIDPFGNATSIESMDHEVMKHIIHGYINNYIPSYLRRWIKIGILKDGEISSISETRSRAMVSEYDDGSQFIAYGEVNVWCRSDKNPSIGKLVLTVVLRDSMEEIGMRIGQMISFNRMELRSTKVDPKMPPSEQDWNNSTALTSGETILSTRLYQPDRIIMAKISENKVNDHRWIYFSFSVIIVSSRLNRQMRLVPSPSLLNC